MSRSHRKSPIFGHTTCRSERQDKKIWHRRWRSKERAALGGITKDLTEHVTLLRNQVSSTWSMGKDGKCYWSKNDQIRSAERRSVEENGRVRLLRRWMAK